MLIPLDKIAADQTLLVGNKAARLALLSQNSEFNVPRGFSIAASIFSDIATQWQIDGALEKLHGSFDGLSSDNTESIASLAKEYTSLLTRQPLPESYAQGIARWL
jgi:phosphoenolpyruvate synthase/pyruvate phosphate dikinase